MQSFVHVKAMKRSMVADIKEAAISTFASSIAELRHDVRS
jgi:hypothetical protein